MCVNINTFITPQILNDAGFVRVVILTKTAVFLTLLLFEHFQTEITIYSHYSLYLIVF